MRWTQFGCFSPLMRPHGKAPRDPWYFGEAAVANYKFWCWVRENLLDYIHHAAVVAHESGIPIMRSMPVAFPQQPSLAAVRDQYMFGEDLLIAPVTDDRESRMVAFPPGPWAGFLDGKTVAGPVNLELTLPLDKIGLYLRPGAAVPVQLNRDLQFGASMTAGRVNALVLTQPSGDETARRFNAQGEPAEVNVQASKHALVWTLKNFPETEYLLLYGTIAAATVSVDRRPLPKAAAIPFDSASWADDPGSNRVIIHLPSRQARSNDAAVRVEVTFNS
jgi:alpha-glucosidase (family GH31 glycosyl hydrolase)